MSKANDRMISKIEDIEKYGLKAKGKGELLKFLNGTRLNSSQTVLAKCYDCMCYYSDGKNDCEVPECPNYAKMPYRGQTEEKT